MHFQSILRTLIQRRCERLFFDKGKFFSKSLGQHYPTGKSRKLNVTEKLKSRGKVTNFGYSSDDGVYTAYQQLC